MITYHPERASLLAGDVDAGTAEELARPVGVVVEAGAAGCVLLTHESAAGGERNARLCRRCFGL